MHLMYLAKPVAWVSRRVYRETYLDLQSSVDYAYELQEYCQFINVVRSSLIIFSQNIIFNRNS